MGQHVLAVSDAAHIAEPGGLHRSASENNMTNGRRLPVAALLAWGFILVLAVNEAGAVTPGIVMDIETGKAILFDADTGTMTGSLAIGPNLHSTGDCVVFGDRGPAYATDFRFRLWALDLEASPVGLAPPPNPVRISNPGEDIAIGPDGRFLVVCDGSGL